MLEFCPLCEKNGTKKKIKLLQINFQEAVWVCESRECIWPFGCEDLSFVPRKVGEKWSSSSEVRKPTIQKTKEPLPISSELSLYTPPVTPSGESAHKDSVTTETGYSTFNSSLSSRSNSKIEGVSSLGDCNIRLRSSCTAENTDIISSSNITWLSSDESRTLARNSKNNSRDSQPYNVSEESSDAVSKTDLLRNHSIFSSSDDECLDSSAKSNVPSKSHKTSKYSYKTVNEATIAELNTNASKVNGRCKKIEGLSGNSCQGLILKSNILLGATEKRNIRVSGSSEHEISSVSNTEKETEIESSISFGTAACTVNNFKNVPTSRKVEKTNVNIGNDTLKSSQTCPPFSQPVRKADPPNSITSDVASAENSDKKDVQTTDILTSESLPNSNRKISKICQELKDPVVNSRSESTLECNTLLGATNKNNIRIGGSLERTTFSATNREKPAARNIEKTNGNVVNDTVTMVQTCPSLQLVRESDLPFRFCNDESAKNSNERVHINPESMSNTDELATDNSTSKLLPNLHREIPSTSILSSLLISSQADMEIPNSAKNHNCNDKLYKYKEGVRSVLKPLCSSAPTDTSTSSSNEPRMETKTMKVDGLPPMEIPISAKNDNCNDKLYKYKEGVRSVLKPLCSSVPTDTSTSSSNEPRMETKTMKVDGLPPMEIPISAKNDNCNDKLYKYKEGVRSVLKALCSSAPTDTSASSSNEPRMETKTMKVDGLPPMEIPISAKNDNCNDKLYKYKEGVRSVLQPLCSSAPTDTSASSSNEPRMETKTMKVDGLPPITLSYVVPQYLDGSTVTISPTLTENKAKPGNSKEIIKAGHPYSTLPNNQCVINKTSGISKSGNIKSLSNSQITETDQKAHKTLKPEIRQSVVGNKNTQSLGSISGLGFGKMQSDKAGSTKLPKKATKRTHKGRKYEGFSFSEIRKKTKVAQSDGESNNTSTPSPGNVSTCSDVTNGSETSFSTNMSDATMDSNYSLHSGEPRIPFYDGQYCSPTKESDSNLNTNNISSSVNSFPNVNALLEGNVDFDYVIDEFLVNDSHNVSEHINDDWLKSLLS